jgi:hypothetical protein
VATNWRDVRNGTRSHPCDGHPCDHCYTCDVLGVCCQTVGLHVAPDMLRAAIIQDAQTVPGLPELVRREAEQRRQRLTSAARPALPTTPIQPTPMIERRPRVINRSDRK